MQFSLMMHLANLGAAVLSAVVLLLCGCSLFSVEAPLTPDQKAICGQQCLGNGEQCSLFFARKNEEQRLLFEQAKENFWICLKKYPDAQSSATPCIAPVPEPERYDSCGPQLDACLAACQTTLEEVAALLKQRQDRQAVRERSAETP